MKCVILAGGLGTRLSEETGQVPKPMVGIGGRPILWHIMKIYSRWGINDFVICLGYKGYVIKEYFSNYFLHMCDVTFDIASGSTEIIQNQAEPWRVTLIDTGLQTPTGGRIRKILPQIENEEAICLTYGDGVADIDLASLIEFHKGHGGLATVTAVTPPTRFGQLAVSDSKVSAFREKQDAEGTWINGGFFVLSPKVVQYVQDDAAIWEREPLERLSEDGELYAYEHGGFWQPMDTLRDRNYLEELWASGAAPWKVWPSE